MSNLWRLIHLVFLELQKGTFNRKKVSRKNSIAEHLKADLLEGFLLREGLYELVVKIPSGLVFVMLLIQTDEMTIERLIIIIIITAPFPICTMAVYSKQC